MTSPNPETDWTDIFAGYALGNLSEEEIKQLEARLAQDPQLAQELFAFQEAFNLLAYDPSKLAVPPSRLKDTILSEALCSTMPESAATPASALALSQEPIVSPPTESSVRASSSSPSIRSLSAASVFRQSRKQRNWSNWPTLVSTGIAAVAVAAFGVTQLQLQQQFKQTTALQQQVDDTTAELSSLRQQLKETKAVTAFLSRPSTQVHALVGTDAASDLPIPNVRLFMQAGEQEIFLVAESLPQLSTSQVYRLWAVSDNSPSPNTIYCGQFRQDADGTARWAAPDQSCTASPAKLLVTLDAPSDPITSAGPLVLESDA